MITRKLYVLANTVWNANDYLNCDNCNPKYTDFYLYATEKEAEQKAITLDVDNDIYNNCTLYTGELSEEEILELSGYATIDEFNEALAEPYSTDARVKNLGEDEKGEVAGNGTILTSLLLLLRISNVIPHSEMRITSTVSQCTPLLLPNY